MNTPLTYKDFTVKAIISDMLQIETLLHKMNARYLGIDLQKDTYFEVGKGKLKLREGTIENLITHYDRVTENGLEKTTVYRYDVNPSADQINTLRRNAKILGVIEKERKIYLLDNVKVHLDKTKNGKTFIEIEAIDREDSMPSTALQFQCIHLLAQLDISKETLVQTGYFTSE